MFASPAFLAQDFFFLIDSLFSCSLGFFQGASLCSIAISFQVLPRTNNLIKLLSNQLKNASSQDVWSHFSEQFLKRKECVISLW